MAGVRRGQRRGRLCAAAAARLARAPVPPREPPAVPAQTTRRHTGSGSTQQALGRLLLDLVHEAPEVAARVVTVSPDVATSTNLGGWINPSASGPPASGSTGSPTTARRSCAGAGRSRPPRRARDRRGQPRRPAGKLGATWSRDGEPLLPVGTIYDPFVTRAHEPWSFGIYAGGRSILVGTPSGVTLGPEGGAHQSVVTPAIGIEQPGCMSWEPAFTQDFEWAFLHALGGRPPRRDRVVLPALHPAARPGAAGEPSPGRWEDVLAGGYLLRPARPGAVGVGIVCVGAVVPEALAAAEARRRRGRRPHEPRPRLPRAAGARGLRDGDDAILGRALRRAGPTVT